MAREIWKERLFCLSISRVNLLLNSCSPQYCHYHYYCSCHYFCTVIIFINIIIIIIITLDVINRLHLYQHLKLLLLQLLLTSCYYHNFKNYFLNGFIRNLRLSTYSSMVVTGIIYFIWSWIGKWNTITFSLSFLRISSLLLFGMLDLG